MKASQLIIASFLSLTLAGAWGCNKASSSNANTGAAQSNANPSSAPVATNNSAAATTNQNNDATAATNGPRLVGIYEINEVKKEGVVTMMSELKSSFTFKPDGTYRRESKKEGKIYHFDTGKFHIEAPDKLVLTIEASKKGKHNPPLVRSHVFSLSSDGSELKMKSDDGKVATYRRVI